MSSVDWAQASSDWARALTVIVPSLCTAAVALLVARWTRSHELKKELRQRRQDTLEKLIDEFQSVHAVCCHLAAAYIYWVELPEGDARASAAKDRETYSNQVPDARRKVTTVHGRLLLLKLSECAREVDYYFDLIAELAVAITASSTQKNPQVVKAILAKFTSQRDKIILMLAEAFDAA
jgi:hypothetical protein